MNSKTENKNELFNLFIKKRNIQRKKNLINEKQRSLNYSTTNITSRLFPSIPSSTSNSNYNYKKLINDLNTKNNNNNNEEHTQKFNEYSRYHFINENNQNEKTQLNLLNECINLLTTKSKKLSPIKNKHSHNSLITNREKIIFKKIKLRNALLKKQKKNYTIWDELKKSKSMKEYYKFERANIIEYIPKYEYIEKQRDINKIINENEIKSEQIKKIEKLYNKENNIVERTKNNLIKSYHNLNNIYDKNTEQASDIIFKTSINENIGINNLRRNKKLLKKEIIELKGKIDILNKEKNFILNWIFLLIKIKENKYILPKYYFDIIDKNISFNNSLLITKEEYERIKLYKKNLVFNDVDEFFEILENINKKIFLILKDRSDIQNRKRKILNLKNKLNLNNNKNIIQNEEEKNLKKLLLLNELKYENKALKQAYTDRSSREKEISKKISEKKTNRGKLLLHIIKLFEDFKKLNFNIIEININYFEREEKIIKKIIECFEINLNYLLNEKEKYNSNEELIEIYKTAENKIKKERLDLNIIKQLKLIKLKIKQKKEKIENRINNQNYLPYRKIDFEHYLKMKIKASKKEDKGEDENEINKQFILYS
jgi:hypothetical protein